MFNLKWTEAQDHRLHILNTAGHRPRFAFNRRFSPADQTRLISLDLDKDESAPLPLRENRSDCCNFHRNFPCEL